MSLKKLEKTILEAIAGQLSDRALLGIQPTGDEVSHTSQFKYESIRDEFAKEINKKKGLMAEVDGQWTDLWVAFYDSLNAAFNAVHAYKYIDNPSFIISFEAQCKSMAIPTQLRTESCEIIKKIVKELSSKNPSERDAGFNPHLNKIAALTTGADEHKGDRSPPFTGGGPWADKPVVASENHQKYANLLVAEGVIGEFDKRGQDFAVKFFDLKTQPYLSAKPGLSRLAAEAYRSNRLELYHKINEYIEFSDRAITESVFEQK